MTLLNEDYIRQCKEEYNLEYFIETGSYLGEGMQAAMNVGFPEENIYSCDILERFVTRLNEVYPKATVINSNSIDFLNHINTLNLNNCLFWLDAHFASKYGGTETDEDKMPIFEELSVIKLKSNVEKDYIMCDDMRVIDDPENITFDPSLHESLKISDFKIRDLFMFDATHSTQLATNGDGMLLFIPKHQETSED